MLFDDGDPDEHSQFSQNDEPLGLDTAEALTFDLDIPSSADELLQYQYHSGGVNTNKSKSSTFINDFNYQQ